MCTVTVSSALSSPDYVFEMVWAVGVTNPNVPGFAMFGA
jgi:hypothetical protein